MAEVKSEADVWRMSVPQLVDHLRTAEAKTLIEDFHAADQLDRLQTALYDVLGARSLLAAQTIAQGALHHRGHKQMSKVTTFPGNRDPIKEMTGCVIPGTSVFVEGRLVPNMTMIDRGETIELILDHRLMFIFPRDIAPLAANFAAQAMAIGAGHPSLSAPHGSVLPYGTPVVGLSGIPEDSESKGGTDNGD